MLICCHAATPALVHRLPHPAQGIYMQTIRVKPVTFFMRVAIADFRALLYMRCFSESRMRCLAFCFASIRNADLATLHCLCGAAVAQHRR